MAESRKLKILTIDNKFATRPIAAWAHIINKILAPCIPHEQWTLGEIERFNRTVEDGIVKQLSWYVSF